MKTIIDGVDKSVLHNALPDVAIGDVHTQYALLAGRAGGQTLIGDTASGGNLTLQSTSHGTKGKILFGTSAYDEVNNRLGIGTASPSYPLDLGSGSAQIQSYVSTVANGATNVGFDFYSNTGNTTWPTGGYTIARWGLTVNRSRLNILSLDVIDATTYELKSPANNVFFVPAGLRAPGGNGTYLQAQYCGLSFPTAGSTNYDMLYSPDTNTSFRIAANPNDGVSALGFRFNTRQTLSTAGAKIASFQNNLVEKAFIDKDGGLTSNGNIVSGGTVRLKSYTVATLPAGTQGDTAFVTDATAPTYLGALTGGGTVVCPVFYNGTAWVSC